MAKILAVDDSDVVRESYQSYLESQGHEVVLGVDGTDGLVQAEATHGVDLIMVDYNMPGMDGISMCGKIREIERYATTPIFVCTTERSPAIKSRGKEVGVIAWLIKPINNDHLGIGITKVLEKLKKSA